MESDGRRRSGGYKGMAVARIEVMEIVGLNWTVCCFYLSRVPKVFVFCYWLDNFDKFVVVTSIAFENN